MTGEKNLKKFNFSGEDFKKLEALAKKLGASCEGEIIGEALAIYETIINRYERDPSTDMVGESSESRERILFPEQYALSQYIRKLRG